MVSSHACTFLPSVCFPIEVVTVDIFFFLPNGIHSHPFLQFFGMFT